MKVICFFARQSRSQNSGNRGFTTEAQSAQRTERFEIRISNFEFFSPCPPCLRGELSSWSANLRKPGKLSETAIPRARNQEI